MVGPGPQRSPQIGATRRMLSSLAHLARPFALALTTLVVCQALAGPPAPEVVVLSAAPTEGPTKGRLRVERAEQAVMEAGSRTGALRVFEDGGLVPTQELTLEVQAPRESLRLEFVDLSGDGAQDLMFHNAETRFGLYADVFLWVPETRRLVQSRTLSQRGEIHPDKRKGCVVVFNKCAGPAWASETLCFNQGAGRWAVRQPARCVDPQP